VPSNLTVAGADVSRLNKRARSALILSISAGGASSSIKVSGTSPVSVNVLNVRAGAATVGAGEAAGAASTGLAATIDSRAAAASVL
jgi:hypothetical protein